MPKEYITKVERERLSTLVQQAGQVLMEYWPGNAARRTDLEIFTKEDSSPVSSADLASNKLIVAGLKEGFPLDSIMSEEEPSSHALGSEGRLWILDPLDGTRIFIEGRSHFAVLLGLCVDGQAEVGFIYVPARDLFISADRGVGVQCNNQVLKVSSNTSLGTGRLYCKRTGRVDKELFTGLTQDSSEAFLLLCQGQIDGLVARRSKCQDWDLAAPVAVIEACGGRVSDENGEPLRFGGAHSRCNQVVMSNGHVHEEVLALLPELEP